MKTPQHLCTRTPSLTFNSNLTVRIRACWAMGNLCDALVLARQAEGEPTNDIPTDVLVQIVECVLVAGRDKDQV